MISFWWIDNPWYNFEIEYLLKSRGEFWGNFGEILGKYRKLDVNSVGSKGLILFPTKNVGYT